jgi:hypothetical protein
MAEAHGTQGTIAFRGRLVPTFAYPPESEAKTPNSAKLRQVPSEDAENRRIDAVIAHAAAGKTVVIPVFGRGPITGEKGKWVGAVYDLQARYVSLSLRDDRTKQALETGVTPYAILIPTYLRVKLTRVTPYAVEGSLVGIETP